MKMVKLYISVIIAMLVIGCGSMPHTYYYRIDYAPEGVENPEPGYPVTVGIQQFTTDVLYESDKIVFRDSPYEAQFYHYRRWIAPPKKIVTEKVVDQFEVSGLFRKVVKIPSTTKVDYILRGNIEAFEEWDDGQNWFGVVTIDFTLENHVSKDILWRKVISKNNQVEKKEPIEVVKAISNSLNEVIKSSIAQIRSDMNLSKSLSN